MIWFYDFLMKIGSIEGLLFVLGIFSIFVFLILKKREKRLYILFICLSVAVVCYGFFLEPFIAKYDLEYAQFVKDNRTYSINKDDDYERLLLLKWILFKRGFTKNIGIEYKVDNYDEMVELFIETKDSNITYFKFPYRELKVLFQSTE